MSQTIFKNTETVNVIVADYHDCKWRYDHEDEVMNLTFKTGQDARDVLEKINALNLKGVRAEMFGYSVNVFFF